jgi:putative ABC transport system ATP-binding protein
MTAPLVEARGLAKVYRMGDESVHALRGVSLRIEHGEFVAIMGASGSGKSTFMNMIGCLDIPSAGELLIDAVSTAAMDGDALAELRNRTVGFVFQQFNLLARTSALDNVAVPLIYGGVAPAERRERARAKLEAMGLGDRIDHSPAKLSGGQQQRVAIARALVTEPKMLLADEPTGALDTATSEEIMRIFQERNAEGITVVLVTHEADIARYARRRVLFRDGQIVSDEPVTDRLVAA